jgi:hypothetical protein
VFKLNISYLDIITKFKENLMVKIKYSEYVMNERDAIHLEKIIGLTCIVIAEPEKNNKILNMRNTILKTKCKKLKLGCRRI